MPFRLIAAMSENRCIGKNGRLPWHLPDDLKRFKELTKGQVVLMGRKTWESIPDRFRPLPNRKNIVLTRDASYRVPTEVECIHTWDQARETYADACVIGGAELYQLALPFADTIHLTRLHQIYQGDAFFPPFEDDGWRIVEDLPQKGYSFVTYKKL